MKKAKKGIKNQFSTFGGVFTPDVLTILGVIMYLRLGWVVGNAGLLGTILIICMAKSVTVCTGLSLSSITTNIKIGGGGAYSIIAKSLGLEAGGSIGIPFYIAQTLSAALYILGFTEGWIMIFPDHNPQVVMLVAWVILFGISYISATFAIKVQYVVMFVIALSIISFLVGAVGHELQPVTVVGDFSSAGFWKVFAVYFPAVTGIMAGANMSGDLKDPRRSLPIGTMASIAVTFVIYILLAVVCALFVPTADLLGDQMVMVKYAFLSPLVLAGILAATFSSALGSMVGAPRVLQALANDKTVYASAVFSRVTKTGEPRNAVMLTGVITIVVLFLGNLDALASLITMFFLITYGMINLVVFLHQSLGLISFRPTFRVKLFIPLFGALSCGSIMLLINAEFTAIALVIIVVLYILLAKKGMNNKAGDLRGGIFLMLAEAISEIADRFPRHHVAWKPDLLIPIDDPTKWQDNLEFLDAVMNPSGSAYVFSIQSSQLEKCKGELDCLFTPVNKSPGRVATAVLSDSDFIHGAKLVIQTLKPSIFRPNILFMTLSAKNKNNDAMIKELALTATRNEMGFMLLCRSLKIKEIKSNNVNLWLRDKSPNWHLSVLLALHLQLNLDGNLNLISVAKDNTEYSKVFNFLKKLSDETRLPAKTNLIVLEGDFKEVLKSTPEAAINICGLTDLIDVTAIREVVDRLNGPALFVRDSGNESAFA